MEEQAVVDVLEIKLLAKRNDCIQALYTSCSKRIDHFLAHNPALGALTVSQYLENIEAENLRIKEEQEEKQRQLQKQEAREKQAEKEKNKKRKNDRANESSKRRKSMIVTIDDISFSFGKEELEQITGQEKQVDPEVKNILLKMNDLFKQLGKKK
ncbi:hypothetical protein NEMIN01_0600 [Nematocida minor]|uniref:uncharacterized protein n=1 Tax=Nematocida minor TaxID=1912983 RepID=UPI0022208610|nr:uncharacterized protein NEMIN01_0600 [Nematocida minor]KAI5189647.1 hypothetical protein NEMIN01_0600 [Nematocida minor]